MQSRVNTAHQIWITIVRLAIAAAALYIVWRLQFILASILVAVVMTYIMLPAVEWISRQPGIRLKRADKRLLGTLVVFSSFVILSVVITRQLMTPFATEITQFSKNFSSYATKADVLLERAGTWYNSSVPQIMQDWIQSINSTNLIEIIGGYVQRILKFVTSSVGIAIELLLIPVLSFYFLLDYKSITNEIYGIVPRSRLRDAMRIGRRLGEILQSYVIGQLILCAIAGILTGLFLWALGMPYIIVLALLAAITRAIPVIGPIASGIPIILVGFLYKDSYYIPFILLIFVTVMHFAESKFIMPRLIGDRLHLRPAVVIIVLLIGAEFFGLIGMFLAAPVAAIIRDLIRYYYILPRRSKQINPMGER